MTNRNNTLITDRDEPEFHHCHNCDKLTLHVKMYGKGAHKCVMCQIPK